MKLKMIVVDLELSARAKKLLALAAVPVALAAAAGVALATPAHVWKDGDTLTAADLNDVISSLDARATKLEAARGKVSVSGITSFAIPQASFVTIPYANVLFDDRGEYDAGTHAFTAKTAGDYEVCAKLARVTGALVEDWEMDLYVNGARERAIGHATSGLGGCRLVRLGVGDKLDVRAYQNFQASLSINDDASWDWLTITEQR